MEQGQDLGRAAADIFVRLRGGLTVGSPTAARVRHGLERTCLIRAPNRQAKASALPVGPLDQPLFAAASGSVTRTRPPCLRLRTTTPVSHQVRRQYAIDAGETVFAPRMKKLLLRAVVLARRRKRLAESTRRAYLRRLDHDLNVIMGLAPANPHGQRLRQRYGKVRNSLFTFLEHPDAPPDNNGSERELRPTTTYRKVTGGFRSNWGADLFAAVRSVIGTAARRGIDAYQAIRQTLRGQSILEPG